jgi:predicted RND superfamily exporter protein
MVNSWIYRLVRLAQRRAGAVIVITAALTLFFGAFALRLRIDPEIEDLIPAQAEVSALLEKYGGLEDELEYVFVSVESGELFVLDKLARFERACARIRALPGVRSAVTPFDLVTFEKEGKKLALVPMAPHARAPVSREELELFRGRLLADPQARNLVIAADGSALGALFLIERRDDYSDFLASLEGIVAGLEPDFTTHISSQLLFSHVAGRYLLRDVPRFVLLAVCLVLLVFYASFRKKRAIVLPSLVVGLGTVWTLGLMSLLGFRLTFVSIMTPPLVLTLGSSYSIHILNQVFRDARAGLAPAGGAPAGLAPAGETGADGFSLAVTRVNKTILLAAATTAVGFASLVTAAIPQVREFGLATAAGVLICAFLSLTFFPALLSRLSPLKERHRRVVTESRSSRFMAALGRRIGRARAPVWVLLAVIAAGFGLSLGSVRYQTDFTSFFRRPEKAVADNLFLAEKFGTFIYVYLSVTAPGMERNYFLDPEALRRIAALEETYRGIDDVSYCASFVSYLTAMNRVMSGKAEVPEGRAMISLLARYFKLLAAGPDGEALMGKFVNEDYSRLTINLRVYDSAKGSYLFEESFRRLKDRLEAEAAAALPAEWQPEIWGSTLGMLYLSETLSRDLLLSALASALLILIITSLSFRSLRFGLLALIPMATGIMLNFIIISLFRIPLDVVTVMFSCVAIGLGVDDSIHLLIQYRRQRENPEARSEPEVMARTLQYAGRPILLTSISLIAGLMILTLSSFTPVVYFGLLVSLAILTTTVGALFVLPAILWRHPARKLSRARELSGRRESG